MGGDGKRSCVICCLIHFIPHHSSFHPFPYFTERTKRLKVEKQEVKERLDSVNLMDCKKGNRKLYCCY